MMRYNLSKICFKTEQRQQNLHMSPVWCALANDCGQQAKAKLKEQEMLCTRQHAHTGCLLC